MPNMNFICPYCGKPTTITAPNQYRHWEQIIIEESKMGPVGFSFVAITCPNLECSNLFLNAFLTDAERSERTGWNWGQTKVLKKWQLLPESEAKVLPEYIPKSIQNDYYEACRIRDLSSKASATLSRRCLQGMIRDFWKINKDKLKDAIDALEKKVDSLTWQAIDAVRSVGNIGAHMEKDINLIVDVDPKEAQLLIGLIEQLVEDWYIEKHEKEERLKSIKAMAVIKQVQRKGK